MKFQSVIHGQLLISVLKILKHSLHVETVEILPQTIALLSWGLPYSKANVEVNNGCLCLSTYYFESNWFCKYFLTLITLFIFLCKYSMCMKLTKFWKRYFRLKKNYAFSKIDFQHQPPPISPSKFHQNISTSREYFAKNYVWCWCWSVGLVPD